MYVKIKHTKADINAHFRSSMLILIPQALILFCMSASPGTPTENFSASVSVSV